MSCQHDRIRNMVCKQGKWEPAFKEIRGAYAWLHGIWVGEGGVMELSADGSINTVETLQWIWL